MRAAAGTGSHDDLLSIRGVSKRYGAVAALSDVSCRVRTGEILGLIGPNGAGKTTLFECVAGVRPASGGTLASRGRQLSADETRRLLFYVPDGIAPWPAETVRWALRLAIGYFEGRADRLAELVSSLQLEPLLDARIRTLSKGQLKRVLVAIGLLTPQPILMADEPFDGLDLRQTRELAAVLRAEAVGGRTLFLSIHQIADAARVCDRFVLLSAGRVCGEGTVDELTTAAAARGQTPAPGDLEGAFLALT